MSADLPHRALLAAPCPAVHGDGTILCGTGTAEDTRSASPRDANEAISAPCPNRGVRRGNSSRGVTRITVLVALGTPMKASQAFHRIMARSVRGESRQAEWLPEEESW
jgi:hypothetical protein